MSFDFDVENIFSIQPKERHPVGKRNSVYDSIQNYANKSFIINEYNNTDIQQTVPAPQDNSEVRNIIQSIALPPAGQFSDIGINVLKPEIICLLDFLPMFQDSATTDAYNFANYSFIFRQYEEQQIHTILSQLLTSQKPEANQLKLDQQVFFNDLHDIITSIYTFISYLLDRSAKYNKYRLSLLACKNFASLSNLDIDLFNLFNSMGFSEINFANKTITDIYKNIILEFRRNLLYTSRIWDNLYTRTQLGDINDDGNVIFDFIESISSTYNNNVSPYLITGFLSDGNQINALKLIVNQTIDLNSSNTAINKNVIRLLMTTLVNEAGVSCSIFEEYTSRIALPAGAGADANILLNKIRNEIWEFGAAVLQQNNVFVNPIRATKTDDGTGTVKPLLFRTNLNIVNGPISLEEYIELLTRNNLMQFTEQNDPIDADAAFSSFIQSNAFTLKAFEDYFNVLLKTDVGTQGSTIQKIITRRQQIFNALQAKVAIIFNTTFDFTGADVAITNVLNAALLRAANKIQDNEILSDDQLAERLASITVTDDIARRMTSQELAPNAYVQILNAHMAHIFLLTLLKDGIATEDITALLLTESDRFRGDANTIVSNNQAFSSVHRIGDFEVPPNDNINQPLFQSTNRAKFIKKILERIKSIFGLTTLTANAITNITDALANNSAQNLRPATTALLYGGNALKIGFTINPVGTTYQIQIGDLLFPLFSILLHGSNNIDSFLKQIIDAHKSYINNDAVTVDVNGGQNTIPIYSHDNQLLPFSVGHSRTQFYGVDVNILLIIYFIMVRDLAVLGSPFSLSGATRLTGNTSNRHVVLDTTNPQLARILLGNYATRLDYIDVITPLQTQFSNEIYDKFIAFVKDTRDTFTIQEQNGAVAGNTPISSTFVSKAEFDALINLINLLREKEITEAGELFSRGGIDQFALLGMLAKQYQALTSIASNDSSSVSAVLNLESGISNLERSLMFSSLENPGTTGFITNELNIVRVDKDLNETKLLVLGIPVGFTSAMNKIMIDEGRDIASFANDNAFSEIFVDIYSRDIRLYSDFALLKTAKFDIDKFVDKSHFYKIPNNTGHGGKNGPLTINAVKLFDKNSRTFASDAQPISNKAGVVRIQNKNEVINHMLKVYVQLIYGINLNESQFFVNRDVLKIDNANSQNDAFTDKFHALVNATISEKLKAQTDDKVTLNKDIAFLIKASDDGVISQYSNKINEVLTRNLINHDDTLSDDEKKIKLVLEEQAVKIANVFKFTQDISGGVGFIQRTVSPKMFEKILVIDVPCHDNCITDYYVKIRMDKVL